ncbi:unnamed protein product [Rhizoctonia solani]|uniref:Uncharacterized protein n=2 Tax=Rhizoctonia solani TaxID=456999 RepID=A0A8H3H7U6_9AGAM
MELLMEIEASDSHRQIFGFGTIGSSPAKSKGDNMTAHCRTLAQTILAGHPSGKWTNEPLSRLSTSVKNRINFLKREYRNIRNGLSETGAGLNSPDEIKESSKLRNIFDQIETDFPYYWRMRDLLFKSPAVEPELLVNPGSQIDVATILATNPSDLESDKEAGTHSEAWDEDLDAGGKPAHDQKPPVAPEAAVKVEVTQATTSPPKVSVATPARSHHKKFGAVAEIAAGLEAERSLRKSVAEAETKERTVRDRYRLDQQVTREHVCQEFESARQNEQHQFQLSQMKMMHQQQVEMMGKNNQFFQNALTLAMGNHTPSGVGGAARGVTGMGGGMGNGMGGPGALPLQNNMTGLGNGDNGEFGFGNGF